MTKFDLIAIKYSPHSLLWANHSLRSYCVPYLLGDLHEIDRNRFGPGNRIPGVFAIPFVMACKVQAGAQPWKTINLRAYADPQAFLLRHCKGPLEGSNRTILRLCSISLFLGPLFVLRLCTG